MPSLSGQKVHLRPVEAGDLPRLQQIVNSPGVAERWGSQDYDADRMRAEFLDDDEVRAFAIEAEGAVCGLVQYTEESDPDYRHAAIDIFVDPARHGRGLGTDAVRTLARHLLEDLGHHRITIDPAADNRAAIACYTKVGFTAVGVMRRYERGPDGSFHDGLLMEMMAEELTG